MLLNLYQRLKLKTEVLRGGIIEDKARGRFIRPLWKKLKRAIYLIAFDTVEFLLIILKKPGHMKPQEAGDGFIRFDSESFKGRYHYYTSHRSVRERMRLFVSTSFSSFVAFLLIFAIILSIAGRPTAYVEAATYNWLQTSWDAGSSATNASHISDQTGWSAYSATSTAMSAGTDLSLGQTTYAVTDDGTLTSTGPATGGGFGNGTNSSTVVYGTGSGANVQLFAVDGGTGADGAYSCTSGTCSLAGATYNYTTFNISAGATVNVTGTTALIIKATGAVTIDGTLSANGGNGSGMVGGAGGAGGYAGGAGGTNYDSGGSGSGPGGGLNIHPNKNNNGNGGGGGHGGAGGDGNYGGQTIAGTGGATYNTANTGGSGGAGGAGDGGAGYSGGGGGGGGGAINITSVGEVTIGSGAIVRANGGTGTADGGGFSSGGGSGGRITISTASITNSGTIQATGGNAGTSAGGGGGGRIILTDVDGTVAGTTSVTGGSGTIAGSTGSSTTATVVYASPGTFTSAVIDLGGPSSFNTVSWNATLNSQTIDIKVRSDSNADMSTATAWASCSDIVSSGDAMSTGGCVTNGHRYVQYQAVLSTTNTAVTPTLNDITVNYSQYTASADLISSAYDTLDPSNAVSSISWTESGVSGSQDIKFQIRTAPDSSGSPGTWTSWLGPTGMGDYYTNPAGGETINSTHTDGASDQWIQYKVFFTSDGGSTPTLSDVTLTYVINAPPDFDATFGNSGVSASQNSGTGLVTIQYKVRDIDTTAGTTNAGFVTPTFEYSTDNGNNWTSIATSTYMTGDITNVAMNESTYTTYTAVWNAKSHINGTYTEQAKVRVTVNDNEALNNTATQASAIFTLDVKDPVLGSVPASVRASTTPAALVLDATDNSSLQYRVGLDSTGADASWTSFSSTTTISLATDPDTTYTVFRDSYGNTTATTTSVTPETPTTLIIQDTSNVGTSDYRLFVAWKQSATPAPGFAKYNILRSEDNATYTQVGSVSTISENYFTDQTVSLNGTYYYKVTTEDVDGNVSYISSSVYGTADGVQNGDEPGLAPVTITSGSVASSGATTDSVTISWTNSVVATSTVYYSAGNTSYNLRQVVDTYSATPTVVLSGLSANTTYYYKVESRDAQGNVASSTSNGGSDYTFTTLNGSSISNVSIADVSNNSATIAFSADISAQTCVFYGTSKPPATSGNCTAGYGTTGQSVTQTGLSSGTRYYIYLRAIPEDTGTYSTSYDYNVLSGVKEYYVFTTSSDSSAPTISSVSASVNDTTADITWATNEKATSQLEYGTASGVYDTITTKVSDLDINHIVSLSDLSPSTKYYFMVGSVDASGNSASSTESSFTTLETQIGESEKVTVVSISTSGSPRDRNSPDIDTVLSQVTEDGIIISWQTTEESDSFVEYGKTTEYSALGFGRRRDSVYSHKVVLPLINFEPGETYHFKVSSRDKSGNLGESNDYTFSIKGKERIALVEEALAKEADKGPISESIKTFRTFLETYSQKIAIKSDISGNDTASEEQDIESFLKEVQDFVPPPILLSKEPDVITTANSAIVKWKTDVEANSIVDFIESDRFDENDPKFDYQAGNFDEYVTDHEVQIANLKTNTEYYMRIKSKNRLGAETKSEKFKVITTEEELEIIAHNTAVSEASIMVEWTTNNMADSSVSYTPVREGNKIISESKTKGDPNLSLIHRIILEGLDMDTIYDLEIKSRTSDGEIALLDLGRKRTGADEEPPVMSQIKVDQAVYPKLNKVQTIISWTTNEPAKSKVVYWEGVEEPKKPNIKDHDEFVTKHIVTLTNLKPGGVYRIKVISEDIAGQVSTSKATAILTPKQSESVTQLIIKNVEDIFNFGKSR
ncbi:MAG: hypothetical protein COU71_00680 [Parcubacteria group bacterium CG10_big_fil_rev_8_21_14_0_10_38_31]|nr:MAG: hypothetical protein COU71_00680 [Parcubacteria group bacterium CG10_big_fil_rev_8_21_14_0_10_38_31]